MFNVGQVVSKYKLLKANMWGFHSPYLNYIFIYY